MNLTKDTTEEQLIEPIKVAREALRKILDAEEPDSERMLGAVHEIWAQEALARFRHEVVGCLQHYGEYATQERDKALRNLFIAVLTRGADDEWSGRRNDARRVAFDIVRKEIADLRWNLAELSGRDS